MASAYQLISTDPVDRQTMAYHVRLLSIAHSNGKCSAERLAAAKATLEQFRQEHRDGKDSPA